MLPDMKIRVITGNWSNDSMKRMILIIAVLIGSASPAFAYIDPGSGSAIMTIVIGLFVAVGVTIKSFWYRIRGFLGIKNKSEKKK